MLLQRREKPDQKFDRDQKRTDGQRDSKVIQARIRCHPGCLRKPMRAVMLTASPKGGTMSRKRLKMENNLPINWLESGRPETSVEFGRLTDSSSGFLPGGSARSIRQPVNRPRMALLIIKIVGEVCTKRKPLIPISKPMPRPTAGPHQREYHLFFIAAESS